MNNLQIKAGTTNVSVVIRIIDSTDGSPETGVVWNSSGIDMEYRREGAAVVNITEATLAALTTAHTDGGFLHIGNGYYRLDVPDAACATGAVGALIQGTVTGMVVIGCYIQLVTVDLFDSVRAGLTALPNAAADAAGGLPISDAGGLDLDAKLANTNEVTAARMGALTDWINGGRLDLLLDAILADVTGINGDAMRGTDNAALASVCTEARLAELAAANLPADVDAILADTAVIGAAGAGLTAIPWNAAWDAEVQSEVADALAVFFTSVASLVDAVWDEAIAGHLGAGSVGAALNAAGGAGDPWATAIPGAYGAGTAGKILGDNINAPIATVDTVVDAIKAVTDLLPNGGALSDLAAILTDTGATLPATLATIAGYLDTEIAAIKAVTDALPDAGALTTIDTNAARLTAARAQVLSDWIDGGRLDLLIDAIPTTAMRGTDGALTDKAGFSLSTAGVLAVWHQALTAVVTAGSVGKLIKDEITSARMAVLTDWINGGRLDLLLDAIPTTAMRGTDNAALASVATEGRLSELDAATGGKAANVIDLIKTAVDAIKTVTDLLPDSGALNTITNNIAAILTDTGTTLDGKVDAIQAITDAIGAAAAAKMAKSLGHAAIVAGAAGARTRSPPQITTDQTPVQSPTTQS